MREEVMVKGGMMEARYCHLTYNTYLRVCIYFSGACIHVTKEIAIHADRLPAPHHFYWARVNHEFN